MYSEAALWKSINIYRRRVYTRAPPNSYTYTWKVVYNDTYIYNANVAQWCVAKKRFSGRFLTYGIKYDWPYVPADIKGVIEFETKLPNEVKFMVDRPTFLSSCHSGDMPYIKTRVYLDVGCFLHPRIRSSASRRSTHAHPAACLYARSVFVSVFCFIYVRNLYVAPLWRTTICYSRNFERSSYVTESRDVRLRGDIHEKMSRVPTRDATIKSIPDRWITIYRNINRLVSPSCGNFFRREIKIILSHTACFATGVVYSSVILSPTKFREKVIYLFSFTGWRATCWPKVFVIWRKKRGKRMRIFSNI